MARILVVDDEAHIRELITTLLRLDGHTVESAADGRCATEAVERAVPDLIVLDLAMPGMDGWRFLEELHNRGLRRQTRVVIVSGNIDDGARERGQESQVRHFLQKPFDTEALVDMVNESLSQDADELYVRRERTDELEKLVRRTDDVLE